MSIFSQYLAAFDHIFKMSQKVHIIRPEWPTCADAILERVPAVDQDLLQRLWLVRQLQVEALHPLQQLVRVVEVQHFGGAIKGLLDVVGEDVDNFQQELDGGLLSIFGWKQVFEEKGCSERNDTW